MSALGGRCTTGARGGKRKEKQKKTENERSERAEVRPTGRFYLPFLFFFSLSLSLPPPHPVRARVLSGLPPPSRTTPPTRQIYDLRLKRYSDGLEEEHPSLDASVAKKRPKVGPGGADAVSAEMDALNADYLALARDLAGVLEGLGESLAKETRAKVSLPYTLSPRFHCVEIMVSGTDVPTGMFKWSRSGNEGCQKSRIVVLFGRRSPVYLL